MAESLTIDDKIYHPIRAAAKEVAYSRDYVTRLARVEKIDATLVGRQWFVELGSLRRYAEDAKHEQAIRQQQLSEQRKQERHLTSVVERQQQVRAKQMSGMHGRAVVAAVGVLLCGVVSGLALYKNEVFDTAQLAVGIAPTQQLADVTRDSPQLQSQVSATEVAQRTVTSLGSGEHGYLLLPSQAHASTSDLFSDEVAVEEVAPGRYEVTRVDATGQPLSTPVPVIQIPIKPTRP